MQHDVHLFLLGAIVMGCVVAGMFFLRFWRRTGDFLFAVFAFAFWALGGGWLLLALTDRDETLTAAYTLRLVAFLILLGGIVAKNRKPPAPRSARAAPRA